MKKHWEVWLLVHDKPIQDKPYHKTWTRRGARKWASRFTGPIWLINGVPTPQWTWEILRGS